LPEDLMPDANRPVLALTLLAVVLTSGALTFYSPVAKPLRIAWLVCLLDTALVTAVVAATGGPPPIFPVMYVLSVTAACVLLSRVGGLAIAAASSVFYTGLWFGRTVFPLTAFFEAPKENTALEIVTIFLNAGTFLVVAIVAGGLAERFRSTHAELETKQTNLRDLEAFNNLIFHSVGTGIVAMDREHRITATLSPSAVHGCPMARAAETPVMCSAALRSEEHTSELQSLTNLVCRLLLESSGAHRDLHSFPTRRSSDLDQADQPARPRSVQQPDLPFGRHRHRRDGSRASDHRDALAQRRPRLSDGASRGDAGDVLGGA